MDASDLSDYQKKIEEYLRGVARSAFIPGLSVTLAVGSHAVNVATGYSSAGVEPLLVHHAFRLGRLSKLLLALLALRHADRDALLLHNPLSAYLPELAATELGEQVSVTHLLTETCGFVVPDLADAQVREKLTLQSLFLQLRSTTALFRPGRVFSASLVHQALLARVLKVLAERPIHLVLRELLRSMLMSAFGTDPHLFDPRLQVASHVFNYNARAALASPSEPLTDFLRLSCGHLHLSPIHIATILQEIATAHATTLKHQRVGIPYLHQSPGAEETPIGAGTGCHAYHGDWFGLDGPAIGQALCTRFHGTHKLAVVIGANIHAPHAINTIRHELQRSLGLAESPPRPDGHKSTPITAGEAAGEYRGMTGTRVVVERLESDLLAGAIFAAPEGGKSVVFKLIDPGSGHWQPTAQIRPFNMGFFRDPDTQDPCILVGNTAYRKS